PKLVFVPWKHGSRVKGWHGGLLIDAGRKHPAKEISCWSEKRTQTGLIIFQRPWVITFMAIDRQGRGRAAAENPWQVGIEQMILAQRQPAPKIAWPWARMGHG